MDKRFYGTEFDMEEIKVPLFPSDRFNIEDFGGKGNGKDSNTEAFKQAIEACEKNGGGTVIVPEGEWFTGPIHLKSNVHLRIEKNAIIKFSDQFEEYLPVVFTRWEGVECYNYSPLIYANGCENIAITGQGSLVGNGKRWWKWKKLQKKAAKKLVGAEYNNIPVEERIFGTKEDALRPAFIQPINSKNILIEGITVINGPMWTIHPVYCENLIIRKLKLESNGPNTDGINPDSCKNVLIEECYFETGDDCIAINSGMNEDGWRVNKPCENIVIRNCHMNEGHGGVVIGSGMSGGVRNIYAHHCKFTGGERGIRLKSMRGRGGFVENIWFDHIHITDMEDEMIQINMFYGSSTVIPNTDTPPDFKNINISNLTGENAKIAIRVYGLPENALENITLQNIDVSAKKSIECHNVKGLTMSNVFIRTTTEEEGVLSKVSHINITDSTF
ncbi:glycosyl hydrolase family 28 [Natranaerovirga pectinivora]|uniref:Glycosyl hydrolase family 28 n=1 Tax=Natranaerovirga pectinivora TaxID=682400 RepID=A0A4R3MNN9_9FIRM|nr:glycoside hydrolase family 28 protein [Natranaerovirga pectinivora]TCT16122.1 glycosyl hydrolase family 28 [Natranaerovirga pectinivora]